ncbi:MAG: tetraacyldisaccharide 4'-kinase [Magnetococcales bacterium]|nr:tetraacyldisaccharide 4'-kinase [Magnetococcales bacterium]
MMLRLLPWLDGRQNPTTGPARLALAGLGGVGMLYGAIQALRAQCYRTQLLTTYHAPCPVISVGNLTTGGTGKTPMVLWLVRSLQQAGRRVAVVSRGYRQQAKTLVTVVADPNGIRLTPPWAADEAFLLARALPGTTILTGRDRPALIRHAVERFQCDLILMDDGFQRLDVHRELNLVLLDAQRPFGNGRLLPGGLLREFPSALKRCDALILTRADDPHATRTTQKILQNRFPDKPVMTAIHRPTAWIPLSHDTQLPLDGLTKPVLAFCAIATPERFLHTLQTQPLHLTGFHPFPDHHFFSTDEITQLIAQARASGAEALVCTEKDAVKLNTKSLPYPLFALRVEMTLQDNAEWLENRIRVLLGVDSSG